MIIKASRRGGGANLANHLINDIENDHVELHNLRGFAAEDLRGAFDEITAQATGIKSNQPFFSASFNPPEGARASIDQFEDAIARMDKEFDLENQPRAIVFHEKEGRRHAHVVWSRVDLENQKAIPMDFYKNRTKDISRDLFLEHGWTLPDGFKKDKQASRDNYSRPEWQQAKRNGLDPKAFKAMLRGIVERSDNRQSFEAALSDKGLYLAQGNTKRGGGRKDRTGFVVLDQAGEVYSLTRYSGYKKPELGKRFGSLEQLPTVDQIKLLIQHRKSAEVQEKLDIQKEFRDTERQGLRDKLKTMQTRQREERKLFDAAQLQRRGREEKQRADRLRKGVRGFFQRITGKAGKIETQNADEREECRRRDLAERQELIDRQLSERGSLQREITDMQKQHERAADAFRHAVRQEQQTPTIPKKPGDLTEAERLAAAAKRVAKQREKREAARKNQKDRGRGRELDL